MKIKKTLCLIIVILFFNNIFALYVLSEEKKVEKEENIISTLNIDWWKELNDPILLDYIIKAIQCNHDLKLAGLKTEETRENKNLVRSKELPSVGIGAVPALYKLPGITNSSGLISLPLYVNYELDLFGKNRDKTKAMDKMYEIARLNEKAAYISVMSAVGSTYYNIVKLDKLISIQKQIITVRKQIYDLTKLCNEEGIISTADTVSANKAYLKANTDIKDLEIAREKLFNMLMVLTGKTPDNSACLERISFDDLKKNKEIPGFINSDVIQNRPDYAAAEKLIEKTGIDIKAAKKEFLPIINILGLLSFNSTEYFSKMNWTNSLGILGGGAILPLFSGGAKVANLKIHKNKYNQAIENYKKVALTSIQEINDALCELKLDNEKYLKTLEIYNAEKQDYKYSSLKFKEGIISNLDLLQKKEVLLITEKSAVVENADYFINQISLYKAVAGAQI